MKKDFPVFQNPHADGGTFYLEGKKGMNSAILLFHGFTATTVEVRPMADFLNQHGFPVSGILLPGHGVSPEEMNQTHYRDWISAAESAYLEMRARFEKVVVMGESMGGLLSLWLTSRHADIPAVLVYAPAARIKRLWLALFVWPFVKFMDKKNVDTNSPWQGFNVIPMYAAAQLCHLQSLVKRRLKHIQQPIRIFQGKLDQTIDPLGAFEVLDNVNSEDKDLIWLDESSHCILLDKQMDIVSTISLEFIKSIAG